MVQWLRDLFRFLRFSRTLTSLPFAAGAYIVAVGAGGTTAEALLVAVAIFLGGAVFLFFNRAFYYSVTFETPRARERERLFSFLGPRRTLAAVVAGSVLFLLVASQFNRMAFLLSPLALCIVFLYVITRQYLFWNHFFLGLAGSLLIIGPHVAVENDVSPGVLVGGIALLLWIAGFDTIYSLKNVKNDRKQGFLSIPIRHGTAAAIYTARTLHFLAMIGFLSYGVLVGLGSVYRIAMLIFAGLLVYSHYELPRRDHLQSIRWFFTLHFLLATAVFLSAFFDRIILGSPGG